MKYYTESFLQSASFYNMFYLPDISLEHYIIRENCSRKLGTHEEAIKVINDDYISHCNFFLREDIIFYDELFKYMVDTNGILNQLDEYLFFKLRYYGTKFLNIVNESRNFFEEERKRFKEGNYSEAIIALSQFFFHDAGAIFEYKENMLRITYNPENYAQVFEFYGIENWIEMDFLNKNPILIAEELYEKPQGVFVYNTLWYHNEIIDGKNHSELALRFTDLIQTK